MAFNLVSELQLEDHFTATLRNAEKQLRKFIRTVDDTANAFRDVERSVSRVADEVRGITSAAYGATAEIYQMNNAFNHTANSAHDVTQEVQQTTNEIQQATVAAAALGTALNSANTSGSNLGGLLGGGGSSGGSVGGSRGTLVKTAAIFPIIIAGATSAIAAVAPLVKLTGELGATIIGAGVGMVGYAAVAIPVLTKVFTAVEDIAAAEEKVAKADTSKARIKAQKELNALYNDMGKGQAKAVKGLQTFKADYMEFAEKFEEPVFEAFGLGLDLIMKLMEKLEPAIQGVSTVVVDMMQKMDKAFDSPAAVSFFDWIAESAGPSLSNLGKIVSNTIGGVLGMFQAFGTTAGGMETGLINLTQRFEEWGQSLGESQGFKDFVAYAEENGPVLMETFGNIIGTVENLIAAFAPMGTDSLETIKNFTGTIEILSEKMIGLSTAAENLSAPIGGVGNASKIAMGPVGWLMMAVDDLSGSTSSLKTAWADTWDSIVRKAADGVDDVIGSVNELIRGLNKIPKVNISEISNPGWVSDNASVPMSGAPKQTSLQQPFRTPTALRNLPIQFPSSPRGYSDGLARVKQAALPAVIHKDESVLTAAQSNTLRSMGVLKSNGDRPVLNTSPMRGKMTTAKTTAVKNGSGGTIYQFGNIIIQGAQKTTKEMARELVLEVKHVISAGALA